ncbi:MAG: tRNA (N(6)-L-threonylcarbamoyladenosine(37)-C(2))-methylthiotransferase MtaB [Chloroflexota bacterium]|nr:tRNA (N(6)-L-threonylcarbamoyladenosine(37)-C(2))-methylthiotransferase MtaB [Chloroflexota bacterium]
MGRPASTVAFKTFGCRVNQVDSDALVRRFREQGFAVVPFGAPADAIVINTCTVTHVADRKARGSINRALRDYPDAVVAITGCYTTVQTARLTELFPRAEVFPIVEQDRLVMEIGRIAGEAAPAPTAMNGFGEAARTRPMVKVQEGCDHVCAFCIVPRARGRSRSRPAGEIVVRVRDLVAAGAVEVVVTGVSLGSYRCPDGDDRVGRLVGRILADTAVPRLRISSIEPMDFDRDLLAALGDSRVCPHLHLPLQSGSDRVLAAMRRPYTAAEYRVLVESIKAVSPDVAIGTDVIVGFPGETDDDYRATRELVEAVGFASLHAFPYSRREGTLAALDAARVGAEIRNARLTEILELGEKLEQRYAERFDGTEREIVWEAAADGVVSGLSDNYLRVEATGAPELAGRIGHARIELTGQSRLTAVPVAATTPEGD